MLQTGNEIESLTLKGTPAGIFITRLDWVMTRSEKLLSALKSPEAQIDYQEKVQSHIEYLYDNQQLIIKLLTTLKGTDTGLGFKRVHIGLEQLINNKAFEVSTKQYKGKRRPVDTFYRDLGDLYNASLECDNMYNDSIQSNKFSGIVLDRLRWIKTIEDDILKLYEGK